PGTPVGPHADPPPDLPANATVAVRLGGNRVLIAGPGNAGRVWDADAGREVVRLLGHAAPVTAMAASADGKLLATGDAAGLVRIRDADTLPRPGPAGHTAAVRSVRVSADGSRALTTADDGTARVWDLTSGRQVRAFL